MLNRVYNIEGLGQKSCFNIYYSLAQLQLLTQVSSIMGQFRFYVRKFDSRSLVSTERGCATRE